MKLSEIAARLDCVLMGDGDVRITGVAGIEEAGAGHLTFVSNPKYASKAKTTKASAVILSTDFPEIPGPPARREPGIDPAARIASTAKIGEGASIGPWVVIEDDVEIGSRCTLHPFVHISRGARIGNDFKAYAHSSVREFCRIGNNVILQDGAKVGTEGYGYAKKDDGSYYKIVQSGIVVLEDDVEVGATATIDRATIGEKRIPPGAKID